MLVKNSLMLYRKTTQGKFLIEAQVEVQLSEILKCLNTKITKKN